MKTLKQLNYHNHLVGNYADYKLSHKRDVICCGWMDVHEDSNGLGPDGNPFFTVKPLVWDNSAVFIYKPKTKWHILSRKDFLSKKKVPGIKYESNSFVFNALKYHGLVPMKIAKNLNKKDYLASPEYKDFEEKCVNPTKPKLVWEWGKTK